MATINSTGKIMVALHTSKTKVIHKKYLIQCSIEVCIYYKGQVVGQVEAHSTSLTSLQHGISSSPLATSCENDKRYLDAILDNKK